MPTSVYVESPDSSSNRLKPLNDGSVNVNVTNPVTSVSVSGAVSVSNFPATQSVAGTVAVSNLPVTQPVSGSISVSNFPATQLVSVSNFPASTPTVEAAPASGDVLKASRSTTGTLITVPSGRVFRGSTEISCSIAVAGSSIPTIADSAGVFHQVEAAGLALTTVTNSSSLNDVYIVGPSTVTFTAGASGTSSGSISGRLL